MAYFALWKDFFLEAGRLATGIRSGRGLNVTEKTASYDIVTAADVAVEKFLTERFQKYFSADGFVGEEGQSLDSRSRFTWYVDPVDGTTNFSKGLPFWGISAGRGDEKGNPIFGMVAIPDFNIFISAEKGDRTYSKGGILYPEIRAEHRLETALIAVGPRHGHEELYARVRAKTRNVLMFGSCVYESYLVIAGQLDGYIHTGATQFDVAGISAIATQVGCLVTDFDGRPIDLRNTRIPFIIARGRAVHDALLEVARVYKEAE